LDADETPLKSYRNEFFPFKAKEQVFNLGAGFSDQTLTKEFVLYNFGGDSLYMNSIPMTSDNIQFSFSPSVVAHNQFTRMKVSLIADSKNEPGVARKNVSLRDAQGKLIAVLPIQYTLEPSPLSITSGPGIGISKVNYDFKVIEVGEVSETSVTIYNTGSDSLSISKVESNCQCLTYQLDSAVIGPGASVEMKVVFNASQRIGYESKTLAIFSNDPQNPTRVLTFKAHVK